MDRSTPTLRDCTEVGSSDSPIYHTAARHKRAFTMGGLNASRPGSAVAWGPADGNTPQTYRQRARIFCMVLAVCGGTVLAPLIAAPHAGAGPDTPPPPEPQWAWIGPYYDTWTCEQDRAYGSGSSSLSSRPCQQFAGGAYFLQEWPD